MQSCNQIVVNRDITVCIATRYDLDGPAIKFRWGRGFWHLSRGALGHIQPPVQWVSGFLPGGKTEGVWRYPLTSHRRGYRKSRAGGLLTFSTVVACHRVNSTKDVIPHIAVSALSCHYLCRRPNSCFSLRLWNTVSLWFGNCIKNAWGVVFWFRTSCAVCEMKLLTTFLKSLWVSAWLVMIWKFTHRTDIP